MGSISISINYPSAIGLCSVIMGIFLFFFIIRYAGPYILLSFPMIIGGCSYVFISDTNYKGGIIPYYNYEISNESYFSQRYEMIQFRNDLIEGVPLKFVEVGRGVDHNYKVYIQTKINSINVIKGNENIYEEIKVLVYNTVNN